MNSKILLLAFAVAAISSCTTAYKTGQTPDDVYYSPARPVDEYVRMEKEDDRRYSNNEDYYDDRYLRMKVHNRTRWSDLDDYYYYDNRYNYTTYNDWNNPWSPNAYWNYCYNPYYSSSYYPYYNHGMIIVNPTVKNIYSAPRRFNLNSYNSNSLTNNNYTNPKSVRTSNSTYSGSGNVNNTNSSSNRSNPGNFLRNIFNNGSSSSTNNPSSSSSSTRSSSSSSSSSSSGGSSSGSSAPVRRF